MAGCNLNPKQIKRMLEDAGFICTRSNKHATWIYETLDAKGDRKTVMTEVPHGEIKGVKTWLSIQKAVEDAKNIEREKAQSRLLKKQESFRNAFGQRVAELKDLRNKARIITRHALKTGIDPKVALQSQKLKPAHLNIGLR